MQKPYSSPKKQSYVTTIKKSVLQSASSWLAVVDLLKDLSLFTPYRKPAINYIFTLQVSGQIKTSRG